MRACVVYDLRSLVYREGRLPQMKHRSGISLYVHKLPGDSDGRVLLCQWGAMPGKEKNRFCVTLLRLSRIGSSCLSYHYHARGGLRGCEGSERVVCALRMEAVSKRYRRARCC